MRHCELKHWNISTFLSLYREGCLRKPRIQRKKKWTLEEEKCYINFLRRHKSSVMPFLVNEKILGSEKIYQVFDGNNRSNAILNFIEKPLLYISEFLPVEYPEAIKTVLQNLSLEKLLKYRYFSKFCKENGLETFLQANSHTENDELFGKMLDELKEMNFTDCILSISVFNNLTGEEMRNIYEEVNTNGKPLTRQEILASSTDSILFEEEELDLFSDIYTKVESYYDDMTVKENEKLPVEKNARGKCINLFEVLIGFQSLLHSKYFFVPEPGQEEKSALDMVFKLFEYEFGGFDSKPRSMNLFLQNIMVGCHELQKIHLQLFNTKINYTQIKGKSAFKIEKNTLVLLLSYFNANMNRIADDAFLRGVKRILVYHILVGEIRNSERKKAFQEFDSLKYEAGGSYIGGVIKKLKETGQFKITPTRIHVKNLLDYLNVESRETEGIRKRRKPLTLFKILLLSVFHDTRVPRAAEPIMKNTDHIIPWDVGKKSQEVEIDLDRLGNLQLIDEKTNKARGKKPITADFIQKYNLQYQNYPSEDTYKKITDGKRILDLGLYNTMCEAREVEYIEILCATL